MNFSKFIVSIFVSFGVVAVANPTSQHGPGLSKGYSRRLCQAKTHPSALEGCPPGTVLVSNSNSFSGFKTIQSAIDSLPHDRSAQTILILAGNYTEQVNVTRPGPLTLLGETEQNTNGSFNKVSVLWSSANANSRFTDNVYTSVLTVAPTLNASLTGSGPTGFPVPDNTPFGNRDFRVYNIDFRNIYAETSAGPSHALSFSRANGGFYYSGFYSYQDTVRRFKKSTLIIQHC
jgi:pectin methylesterase-like acyl-CoA thioesterase